MGLHNVSKGVPLSYRLITSRAPTSKGGALASTVVVPLWRIQMIQLPTHTNNQGKHRKR